MFKTLIQRSKMLVAADNSNGEKRIDYQYDLISGKVNKVIYQPDKGDQFIHRYDYDADNRIISVNTSRDGLIWQNDAKYVYHLHGPLARTELGDQKVQGLDYAYTLQGWLKGVNSSSLHDGLFDIGQDGKTGGSLPIVGRGAFGYMLDYYIGDYKPIGQQAFSLNTFTSPSPTPATGFKSLYNGNIGAMVTNIRQLNTPQYTYYHYDQLNRIKRMEALHGQNAAANTWTFGLRFNGYIEAFTYDPNGNIMTLSRNSNVEQIDDLTYHYLPGTNKLTSVSDNIYLIPNNLVNYDIDNQVPNNYTYDRIGNLTGDISEGISSISWTVYGKIKTITKSTGTIDYRYDASGNRIYKKTVISGTTTETYYARDAQGNVMAVYEKQAANPLKWMEQHLYGSSRLGMWNLADVVPGTTIPASGGTVEDGYLYGSKFFELSNHLGNVLVTVSDKKIGIDDGANGTTDYFQPEVLTAQDYYSFGMSMPGRKYTKPNSGYRYGFNGKENDNDVKGESNQQDYGMRIYDPRLGKFLSVDPLTKSYPWYTPYQFAGNSPIASIDLDGAEEWVVTQKNGQINGFNYNQQAKPLGPNQLYLVNQDIKMSGTGNLLANLAEYIKNGGLSIYTVNKDEKKNFAVVADKTLVNTDKESHPGRSAYKFNSNLFKAVDAVSKKFVALEANSLESMAKNLASYSMNNNLSIGDLIIDFHGSLQEGFNFSIGESKYLATSILNAEEKQLFNLISKFVNAKSEVLMGQCNASECSDVIKQMSTSMNKIPFYAHEGYCMSVSMLSGKYHSKFWENIVYPNQSDPSRVGNYLRIQGDDVRRVKNVRFRLLTGEVKGK